jgi:sugar/nucleoside kinase (ribokinase family)
MQTYDFSAIGFLVLDVLGRYTTQLPPAGGATFIEQIRLTVAGTAGATAMGCGILGLNGQIVAEVGRDDMGDFLVRKLTDYGVDTGLISRNADVQTSCSMLPIRPGGARAAFFVPGTAATFSLDNNQLDAALDARIIHLGGTGLLHAFDGAPSLAMMKRAKELGRITVFDLILANAETTKLVEPLLPYIDYFVPSIDEAAQMAGTTEPSEVARFFKSKGVKNALLTLEGDGVYVDPEHGEPFSLPAHAIDVVDTTGCGDGFTAGLITGLAKGWDIDQIARFANAVAAQVAMGLGSDGKLTSFEETVEVMQTWPLRH